jgi:hypothetical protein
MTKIFFITSGGSIWEKDLGFGYVFRYINLGRKYDN